MKSLHVKRRLEVLEHVYAHLQGAESLGYLSEPSLTWLDRMKHAMCDDGVGPMEYTRLDELFIDYLERLPEAEREELERRYIRFVQIVEVAPAGAESTGEILREVVRSLEAKR